MFEGDREASLASALETFGVDALPAFEPLNSDVSGSEQIWSFFARHSLPVAPEEQPSLIPVLNGEFEQLFSKPSGLGWLEGPAFDRAGGIWFSDLGRPLADPSDPSAIYRFDIESGETQLKLENTGGANGLAFANDGSLIAAHGYDSNVTSRDVNSLTDSTELAKANQAPNDLALDNEGGFYFTDAAVTPSENAIFYVSAAGDIQRFPTNVSFNNGIALSPDGETLYAASTGFGTVIATWARPVH